MANEGVIGTSSDVQFDILNEVREENKQQLFLQGLSAAQQGYVLYVSQNEITNIPSVHSFNRHYLKRLTFLYLNNFEALIEGMATLPEWQNVPSTLIVDGFNEYCSGMSNESACGLVGLLLDTARSCARVLTAPCRLIVSIDKDSQSYDLYKLLYELYGQLYQTKV